MSVVSPQRDQGGEDVNSRQASVIATVIRERLHRLLPLQHNKLNVIFCFLFAYLSGSDVTGFMTPMYCMVKRIRTVVIKPEEETGPKNVQNAVALLPRVFSRVQASSQHPYNGWGHQPANISLADDQRTQLIHCKSLLSFGRYPDVWQTGRHTNKQKQNFGGEWAGVTEEWRWTS